MKSNECQKAKRAGDVVAARQYSESAKNLLIATIVVGIIFGIIAAILKVVRASRESSGYY